MQFLSLILQKKLPLLLLITLSPQLPAQQIYERPLHDRIWLFNNSRMDFNYDPVLVEADDQPMPFEGTNASICDEDGQLLAYTNGIYIADQGGDTIMNSFYFNPGMHAEQWVENGFIFPQMGLLLKSLNGEKYFLFHENVEHLIDENEYQDIFQSYNFSQTKLFINDGDVETSLVNDTILTGNLGIGQLTASRNGDGSSWWIPINTNYTNSYAKLLLSDDTLILQGNTVIGDSIQTGLGAAKFSPNGTKYAKLDLVNLDKQTISIYNFDRCTGDFHDPIHISYLDTAFVGGLAFSENSRFLYVSSFRFIYQYDLAATDVPASKITVATPQLPSSKVYFMAQLAPDGKIYICTQGTSDSLHVIHHPNRKGHACGFEHLGQPLPANSFRTMPNYPYYGLGPWDGSPCDTLGIDNPVPEAAFEYTHDTLDVRLTFFDASHYAYEWAWDFGDGSPPLPSMTTQHPVHTYAEPGAYQVCLTASNFTGNDTYCETIQIGPVATQEVVEHSLNIDVWPNPTNTYFRISGEHVHKLQNLELYDLSGKLHQTWRVASKNSDYQLSDDLSAGIYLLSLQLTDGSQVNRKMVISK